MASIINTTGHNSKQLNQGLLIAARLSGLHVPFVSQGTSIIRTSLIGLLFVRTVAKLLWHMKRVHRGYQR
ncbi:hypothetical protein LINPERPRIM_LOCUS18501 [Linum perenne]